jgi:hypothetical protein
MRRARFALIGAAIVAVTSISLVSPGIARASVCMNAVAHDGSTAQVCITSPAPGATVSGDVVVTGTASWTRKSGSDTAGCPGERLTPSGCVTWTLGTAYVLTHLYKTPGTSFYRWTWHTVGAGNGPKTLNAQIKLDGVLYTASVPVVVSNASSSFPSPHSGLIPAFTQATPFVIAATGDGAAGSTAADKVAAMMRSWNPKMAIYLGDVYQRGSRDEFLDFFDPVFGPMANVMVSTVGNHEYKIYSNAWPYFWYWNFPQLGPNKTRGGGSFYSFDAGGWHIISLNANIPMDPSSPQGIWLHNDLASHPNSTYPCTMAFWHQERFSDISLRLPSTSALWGPLYDANADVILNAHAHAYERWQPLNKSGQIDHTRGITQLVAGTGGNVLSQNWQTTDPRSAFRDHSNWGAVKLTLLPGKMDYQFVAAASKDGSPNGVRDSGTITCH